MSCCDWANVNERNKNYHDTEWGVPVRDDRVMFEHLMLEAFQCGLSWDLMLRKRDIFRACFDNFDYERIALYTPVDAERIMNTEGMLRSKRKIDAVIGNARCYIKVREEFGSFCDYIWSFTGGKTILYKRHSDGARPVSNGLSEEIAKDLRKRGFKYVGAITVYSHMQACGMINDHDVSCPRFDFIISNNPTVCLDPDREVF